MRRLFLFCVIAALALPGPPEGAHAATPPLPAKKQTLADLQKQRDETLAAKKELEEDLAEHADALDDLKDTLTKTGRKAADEEKKLNTLDASIRELTVRRNDLQASIASDEKLLGDLVAILQRLRRMPPEAMLFSETDPAEAARRQIALKATLRPLLARADQFRAELDELAKVDTELKSQQEKQAAQLTRFVDEQKKLGRLVDKRQKMIRATETDLARQERELSVIAKESDNVRDLIARIARYNEDQRKAAPPAARKAPATAGGAGSKRQPGPTVSAGQWPVGGAILVGYGEKDDLGATSEGITFSARAGAVVISPLSGTVKYTGPFKHYGNLTILDHGRDTHSLVAGSYKIDTVVGQNIASGEPIGRIPQGKDNPKIYFELRHNGQPTNPAGRVKKK